MFLRPLNTVEKSLLRRDITDEFTGIILSTTLCRYQEECSDGATLLTADDRDHLKLHIAAALQTLLNKHLELSVTMNKYLEFMSLKKFKVDDVLKFISVDCDEFKSQEKQLESSNYVKKIISKSNLNYSNTKPLWRLFIVNERQLIFYCSEVIFDIFSAAHFIDLLLHNLNQESSQEQLLIKAFKVDNSLNENSNLWNVYDNPHLNFWRKPSSKLTVSSRRLLESVNFPSPKDTMKIIDNLSYISLFKGKKELETVSETKLQSRRTVMVRISNNKLESFGRLIKEENINFKSFICGMVMLSLKPLISDFSKTLSFSIKVDLRPYSNSSQLLGLCYKDIIIDCPINFVDDNKYTSKFNANESLESILEMQFKRITKHIQHSISEKIKLWTENRYNDMDIKRMKMGIYDSKSVNKLIQINDFSNIAFNDGIDNHSSYVSQDFSIQTSPLHNELMALSISHCNLQGMIITISHPEIYNLKLFFECFDSFVMN